MGGLGPPWPLPLPWTLPPLAAIYFPKHRKQISVLSRMIYTEISKSEFFWASFNFSSSIKL
jgi:hypothetical protein